MKLPPVAQATRCKMHRLLLQKVVIDGWCCIRFAHSFNVHIGRPICKKYYNERIENQFKVRLNICYVLSSYSCPVSGLLKDFEILRKNLTKVIKKCE